MAGPGWEAKHRISGSGEFELIRKTSLLKANPGGEELWAVSPGGEGRLRKEAANG